jgi:hypothetical protein
MSFTSTSKKHSFSFSTSHPSPLSKRSSSAYPQRTSVPGRIARPAFPHAPWHFCLQRAGPVPGSLARASCQTQSREHSPSALQSIAPQLLRRAHGPHAPTAFSSTPAARPPSSHPRDTIRSHPHAHRQASKPLCSPSAAPRQLAPPSSQQPQAARPPTPAKASPNVPFDPLKQNPVLS